MGDGGATAIETGEPVEGGRPVIGIDKARTTLNPHQCGSAYEGFIIDRTYQYGTTNNPNNQEFEPWLVPDWTLNPSNAVENLDSLTLEWVTIRDDMTSHDVEDVTAEDFAFTVRYFRDQNPTQSLTGAAYQVVDSVEVQSFNSQLPTVYAQQNFDIFSMGWALGVNVTHFSALYSSQGADLGGDVQTQKFNPMGYTGAGDLIEADRNLMDFSKRIPYVQQIQTEIYAEAPTSVTEVRRFWNRPGRSTRPGSKGSGAPSTTSRVSSTSTEPGSHAKDH